MTIVGFTGTKLGMTAAQCRAVRELLVTLEASEFHHGDCIGADLQAAQAAVGLDVDIVVHPASDPKLRAFFSVGTVLPEKPYIPRNHDIVDACEVLVATPRQRDEELRSGTWATVRYARKTMKPIVLVFPDGTCEMTGEQR